jgi:cullin-associated NEDD8-dissociated protein 1
LDGFDVSFDRELDLYSDSHYVQQRKTTWATVALKSPDQLRQRVAWALSQILVVTTFDIEAKRNSECFLNFYDILVRNAFGSYYSLLKEVVYSPLMGEMLTYTESKSSAYIWEEEKRRVFADENMAREVLQLFTTGLVHLNLDGTPKFDANGETIPVYNQDDILSYARGWTGFRRRRKRSNTEGACLSTFGTYFFGAHMIPCLYVCTS